MLTDASIKDFLYLSRSISDGCLKAMKQPKPVKNDGKRGCQDIVNVRMVQPMLSVMENPSAQNNSKPKRLAP